MTPVEALKHEWVINSIPKDKRREHLASLEAKAREAAALEARLILKRDSSNRRNYRSYGSKRKSLISSKKRLEPKQYS